MVLYQCQDSDKSSIDPVSPIPLKIGSCVLGLHSKIPKLPLSEVLVGKLYLIEGTKCTSTSLSENVAAADVGIINHVSLIHIT